jgi:hypothetical protein
MRVVGQCDDGVVLTYPLRSIRARKSRELGIGVLEVSASSHGRGHRAANPAPEEPCICAVPHRPPPKATILGC